VDPHTLIHSNRASCLGFEELASRALLACGHRIAPSDATAIFIALFRYKVPMMLVTGASAADGLILTLSKHS
jgi:hypothetical protein